MGKNQKECEAVMRLCDRANLEMKRRPGTRFPAAFLQESRYAAHGRSKPQLAFRTLSGDLTHQFNDLASHFLVFDLYEGAV